MAAFSLSACERPSEPQCREAISNMYRLRNLSPGGQAATEAEIQVRQCRATGKMTTVRCLLDARTSADIDRCTTPEQK